MAEAPSKENTGSAPSVRPIGSTHRALHEEVADQIRSAIVNGELYPGERLVEDRLAHQLDVSRHPVREALRTLQLEGFVDISPRRGATVSRISSDEGSELFEVLSALDGLAARLAAAEQDVAAIARTEGVLEEADLILASGLTDLSRDDLGSLADLNRRFHRLIGDAAGNRQLTESITPLRDRIQWIQGAVNRRRPELSWAEHRKIYEAVASGDGDAAEAMARAHIEAARVMYLSQRSGTTGV